MRLGIGDGRKVFLYFLTGLVFSHSVWGFSEQGELPVCPWLPVLAPLAPVPGSQVTDSVNYRPHHCKRRESQYPFFRLQY